MFVLTPVSPEPSPENLVAVTVPEKFPPVAETIPEVFTKVMLESPNWKVLLAITIAPEPIAVELLIVVPAVVSADVPINVLELLSVFKTSPALDPTAVL